VIYPGSVLSFFFFYGCCMPYRDANFLVITESLHFPLLSQFMYCWAFSPRFFPGILTGTILYQDPSPNFFIDE
jgi:hypothetical protein